MSLYEVLGLTENKANSPSTYSQKDIRDAYQLVRDTFKETKVPGKDQTEWVSDTSGFSLQAINHAYACLSDPASRRVYDKWGERGLRAYLERNSAITEQSRRDIEESFKHTRHKYRFLASREKISPVLRDKRAIPIVSLFFLTLAEVDSGCRRTMRVFRNSVCQTCRATGAAGQVADAPRQESGIVLCVACTGSGVHRIVRVQNNKGRKDMLEACRECFGSGFVFAHSTETEEKRAPCEDCEGRRYVRELYTHEVEIPAGISAQNKIEFEGQGHETIGGDRGDIVISIEIVDPPSLREDPADDTEAVVQKDRLEQQEGLRRLNETGPDLTFVYRYGIRESIFGVSREIRHFDGHPFRFSVPQVRNGMVVNVPNQGLPFFGARDAEPRADHEEKKSAGPPRSVSRGGLFIKLVFDPPAALAARLDELSPIERDVLISLLDFLQTGTAAAAGPSDLGTIEETGLTDP